MKTPTTETGLGCVVDHQVFAFSRKEISTVVRNVILQTEHNCDIRLAPTPTILRHGL